MRRWLRDYTILALRLNKALWQRTAYLPVEEYQPPEWEEQVRHEPVHPADLLLRTHNSYKTPCLCNHLNPNG